MGQPLTRIYYIVLDGNGKEIGTIPIALDDQGHADLSGLPAKLREKLQRFGASSTGCGGGIFPENGSLFLEELLRATTPHRRFKITVSDDLITN